MKRFILLALLIAAAIIGGVTATGFRYTSYGPSVLSSPTGAGERWLTINGGAGNFQYYKGPTYAYSTYTDRRGDYAVQLQAGRSVSNVYQYGYNGYRTAQYGDWQVMNVQGRSNNGGFYVNRDGATGSYYGYARAGTVPTRTAYRSDGIQAGYRTGAYAYNPYYQYPSTYGTTYMPSTASATVQRYTIYN